MTLVISPAKISFLVTTLFFKIFLLVKPTQLLNMIPQGHVVGLRKVRETRRTNVFPLDSKREKKFIHELI